MSIKPLKFNETVIKSVVTKKVLALSVAGKDTNSIAKELNITKAAVVRIQESAEFKSLAEAVGEKSLTQLINETKEKTAKMLPLALSVLHTKMLEMGDEALDAAKVVIKMNGLYDQEKTQTEGNITIVMPGAPQQEKFIEVEKDVKED